MIEVDAAPEYRPRVVDAQLARLLETVGAVVIEGPRGCGKTMTGLQHARSHVFIDDPAVAQLATLQPELLIDGESPRLLDEWRLYPDLWNLARRRVDATAAKGQFILAGSAVPAEDVRRHTGAGRFVRVRQYTMTWAEKLGHEATVSLRQVVESGQVTASAISPTLLENVEALLKPGFPALLEAPEQTAVEALRSYVADTAAIDLHRLADLRQEPIVIQQLVTALARSTATEASFTTLRRDLAQVVAAPSDETVAKLVQLLQRVFLVDAVPALSVGLRSRARLRRAQKYHLADPTLAAALLDADRERLLRDGETLGLLFESAVIHDLRVYAQALGGTVYHYRDSNGHKLDAVIELPGGRWVACEVKLAGSQIEAGAASLNRAVAQIDRDPPLRRVVITGTGFTARLAEDMVTFPLLALGA